MTTTQIFQALAMCSVFKKKKKKKKKEKKRKLLYIKYFVFLYIKISNSESKECFKNNLNAFACLSHDILRAVFVRIGGYSGFTQTILLFVQN